MTCFRPMLVVSLLLIGVIHETPGCLSIEYWNRYRDQSIKSAWLSNAVANVIAWILLESLSRSIDRNFLTIQCCRERNCVSIEIAIVTRSSSLKDTLYNSTRIAPSYWVLNCVPLPCTYNCSSTGPHQFKIQIQNSDCTSIYAVPFDCLIW